MEAFSVTLLGAVLPRRNGESLAVPPESQEHEQTGHGGLAGTWEVLTIPRKKRHTQGRPGDEHNAPWPITRVSGVIRSENRIQPWYRQAKETKRGGRVVRKS